MRLKARVMGGIYRAGYDFPAGPVCIMCEDAFGSADLCLGVGEDPGDIYTDIYFRDKVWVDLKVGDYVRIDARNEDDDFSMNVYEVAPGEAISI